MTKKCLKCGKLANEQVRFCSQCGASEFMWVNADVNNQQGQQVYGEPQMSGQVYLQPQAPKKGIRGWQILLIIVGTLVGALFVLGMMGVMVKTIVKQSEALDGESSYENSRQEQTIKYTKGNIVDGYYVNEWANIKFEITEQWPEGDDAAYSLYAGPTTECGFISEGNLQGKQFAICFEDLSRQFFNISEEDYLNLFEEKIKKIYSDASISCEIGEYFDTTIAGKTYKVAKINLENGLFYQYLCVYKIDDYIMYIAVTSADESEIKSVLSSIKTVE